MYNILMWMWGTTKIKKYVLQSGQRLSRKVKGQERKLSCQSKEQEAKESYKQAGEDDMAEGEPKIRN